MPPDQRPAPDNAPEFLDDAGAWPNDLSRRKFLQLMGASIALASATGCTRNPPEHIVPYLRQPEEIIPGKPLFYATALTLDGYARGVLVETHEGRPTKIEGNPDHPASLGATDVFMQAELLALYDPERSPAVMHDGQISTWEVLLGEISTAAQQWKTNGGAGLRILTRHETSPTLLDQLARLLTKYPGAKWHEFDPLAANGPAAIYHFDKADVILSLGADFLASGPMSLRYAREFSVRRRPNESMNRLYAAESTPTLTGSMADHQFVLPPDELENFAQNLPPTILADLQAHRGRSLVVAGEFEAAAVHEAARQLNEALGNVGVTVDYLPSPASDARDFAELIADINSAAVDTLFILGGNPAYDAPADFDFAKALPKIARSVHLGLYHHETAALCRWHAPEAHALESWSDARAFDGTATIVQPMIEPLFAGRSRHELLAAALEEAPASSYEIVRAFWQKQPTAGNFEQDWRKALHDGVVVGSVATTPDATPAPISNQKSAISNSPHLLIRPSPRLHDGRYANNAWLQELPDPITGLVWDNAALVSHALAQRLKLANGDVVNLKFRGRSVRAPIWIQPGQADNCVTVTLGYGRRRAGSIGTAVGFNAYALRTSDARWGGPGLEIEKTGERHGLVTTQHHWNMEGREQVRVGTLVDFQKRPAKIAQPEEPAPSEDESLYPRVAYNGHAWGMAIDLNACMGCGVCTIACQAENNIPVVGKEQVAMNREMHWIRVDRYYESDPSLTSSRMLHQPVPCMHCENAPCELVCPVAATVHSSEGLNQMIYNRCIGTRYCSNNCPYKVRRFNFLEYDANQFELPATRKLMRNPNVTVRSRGVMEKCTYCIQRINAVKIESEKANRAIRDGEITPACAQACPVEAIVFGDLNDQGSRVANLRASPLNYGLLAELNTRPRTTYLAKLRNPNPAMAKV
ncbi:MAG TPA: 4Fe-4S dicluster domain-containing protein [Chthoniobacterales bacterium]|nr:4Fe-4S dicluster domain-containing protein [Chthoniobacterales bacterium]